MRRSAIFTLAGAVPLMIATFSYAMIFLDGPMEESAFRLVIGGSVVGGFLGLLVAELTRPSGTRRTRLAILTVGGLLAGLVYGVIALEEVCEPGPHVGCYGWVFLGSLFRRFWAPIALWIVFGASIGALLGYVAGFRLARPESALESYGRGEAGS
jgi:hypothetical protein